MLVSQRNHGNPFTKGISIGAIEITIPTATIGGGNHACIKVFKTCQRPPLSSSLFPNHLPLILSLPFPFNSYTMMFKSVLVAIATAALVSAQSIVSITSPLGNNVYTAGGQAIITWVNPTVDTIPQIELSKGPSTLLQPVLTVATNVNAKDMQYTWNIPTTITPGSDCK